MNIKQTAPASAETILATLKQAGNNAGVIIMQCDTIYGLVGIYPTATERIREIKGREAAKSFLLLIGDPSWLPDFTTASLPPALQAYWPGPLTLIFPAHEGGTVALRVPQDDFLRDLLARLKLPLISTSVNKAGEAPLSKIAAIKEQFQDQVDLIVDSGDSPNPLPSTILDITVQPYKLLRQGVLKLPPELFQAAR